jgi:hypothetical protein
MTARVVLLVTEGDVLLCFLTCPVLKSVLMHTNKKHALNTFFLIDLHIMDHNKRLKFRNMETQKQPGDCLFTAKSTSHLKQTMLYPS